MLYEPFRQQEELLGDCDSYAAAYAAFLVMYPLLFRTTSTGLSMSQLTSEDVNTELCLQVSKICIYMDSCTCAL